MLFTAQKLADKTGIAPSTCRYWLVNLFESFAPARQNKKWNDEALDLILQIKQFKKQDLDNEEIKERLRKTLPVNAEEKTIVPFEQETQNLLFQIVVTQQKQVEVQELYLQELKKMTEFLLKSNSSNKPKRVSKPKKRVPSKKPIKTKKSRGVGRIIKTIFSEPFK